MSSTGDFELILSELVPMETLLWSGRPSRRIRVRWQQAIMGLVFATIACLVVAIAVAAGEYIVLIFIGFFLLAALSNPVNDAVLDPWRRRKTVYALTDRRALVIDGLFAQQAQSFPLPSSTVLTLREGREGSGTIYCSSTEGYCYKKNKRGQLVPRPLFRMIVDARHVYDLMRETQANAPARRQ
jgi:hypothetical protein